MAPLSCLKYLLLAHSECKQKKLQQQWANSEEFTEINTNNLKATWMFVRTFEYDFGMNLSPYTANSIFLKNRLDIKLFKYMYNRRRD